MNLQENIQRIKQVMGLNEIEIRDKPMFSGGSKDVYPVIGNSNIIYKVSGYNDLQGEKELFGEYPDLFCHTYGEIKKLKNPDFKKSSSFDNTYDNNGKKYEYTPKDEDSYYLAYEKLDTNKFENFYNTIMDVFNTYATDEIKGLKNTTRYPGNSVDYFHGIIFEIATNPNKDHVVKMFHSMNQVIEREAPKYYNDYLNFVDL